ncbi:glycosyltransferase family 2 protein [Polymorphum gilvum]|uniref:Glycosyl transferase family 2 n=1 Tax=Polymorphum gilvum (strain LMG 25793 / CGMCC 1.9160 / SL003B-26A1) TaxID=991905 RepID=F2IVH5_POLGS|nr:glycosyltransferase family 2 protein [Polymorphum gilvum]ADZ72693.1 Glycosyl transferase family 2 [Polymorphum gilvum SL003B-26A1]
MAKVQVALPVYNGSTYLRQALESLEAQTYRDFEVIVYNNASKDASGEIAEEFAARNAHFRVVHRPQTVPLLDNFLGTFENADCDYLVWRAHDDYSDPTFLEVLAGALDARPDAALAAPTVITHKRKRDIVRRMPRVLPGKALEPASLLVGSHASWIYGMFRPRDLERCYRAALANLDALWAIDHATMLPLILDRRVVLAPAAVFHQQILEDPIKWRMAQPSHAEKKQIFRQYLAYGNRLIGERDFTGAQRLLLRAVFLRHVSKRTFRIHRLLRAELAERLGLVSAGA